LLFFGVYITQLQIVIKSALMKETTVSFHTLGCRLNQSETAVIQNTFANQGYCIVMGGQPADISVINTCTVTESGDADTRRLINRLLRINPKTRIALIGCQAQIQKERLVTKENIKWVIGNEQKMDLVNILQQKSFPEQPIIMTGQIGEKEFSLPSAGIDRQHTRANLKIQDGCDFFCSFCEIPFARGRPSSRVFSDIMKEARVLVTAGHQELVLTGINVGKYRNQGKTISDVILSLEDIAGLERIRISSIEMTTIPDKLLSMMARPAKLCRHLHIPLQSGHDAILQKMQRKYSTSEFIAFVQKAVDLVEGICLGSDIMVGFPGENENIFEESRAFVLKLPISYLHVFSYSKRNLAKSRTLVNTVSPQVISQRSFHMRQLSQEKRMCFYQSQIGSCQKVIFEQKKGEFWVGLTDNFVRVKVRSSESLANRIREVKLTDLTSDGVIGECI
jgi:threonylcarbamoyladenosine tRNA methylthiotransferase MtaB